MDKTATRPYRLPRWMKAKMPEGYNYSKVRNLILENKLNTICTSGNCPNKGECWNAGTASFMILGDKCTRNCRFCDVLNKIPGAVDEDEPKRLAESIAKLNLKHCVITSVTRDDLPDQGAQFWAKTLTEIKKQNPHISIEALIPDMDGKIELLDIIINAEPEVLSHNLETVRSITPKIRSRARYDVSLSVIKHVSQSKCVSKSGIMLGLGETKEEVLQTMDDLRSVHCKVLTIGQYLQPAPNLMKVHTFVTPDMFKFYQEEGLKRGFSFVESSPMVRSSYHAEKHANA